MALDLNDKTSNSNNLTNHSGAEVTTSLPFAQSSKAIQLSKANSAYLEAIDSPSLSFTSDFTFEFWVKFDSLPANGAAYGLISKMGASPNWGFFVDFLHDNLQAHPYNIRVNISSTGSDLGGWDVPIPTDPIIGTWYHYAIVYTAASHKIEVFINGSSIGSDTTGTQTSIFNNATALVIGADNITSVGNYNDATFDDIRIWNTPRTGTQITNNYTQELAGNESGLVAYWPLEVLNVSSVSPSASSSASVSPSASRSPSASISPSASASSSLSPSASASASPSSSLSPSASFSPSSSQSASTSPSGSFSASVSPSGSASASASPSASESLSSSASPSPGYARFSRGDEVILPSDTNDLETLYTEQEEARVETYNDIYVTQEGAQQYMLHQFKVFVGQAPFCQVEWEGKSTLAPSDSPVYLQVFNQHTNSWQTIDSNGTAEENIDFELEEKIRDTTNYRDAQNIITCRVYQLAI